MAPMMSARWSRSLLCVCSVWICLCVCVYICVNQHRFLHYMHMYVHRCVYVDIHVDICVAMVPMMSALWSRYLLHICVVWIYICVDTYVYVYICVYTYRFSPYMYMYVDTCVCRTTCGYMSGDGANDVGSLKQVLSLCMHVCLHMSKCVLFSTWLIDN